MKKRIIKILKKLIPKNLKKNAYLRKTLAFLANAYFGFPSKKLTLIGVTGTTGKTTTTFMIKSILEAAGIKTGLIGTAGYYFGSEVVYNQNEGPGTTPDPFILHRLFKQMVAQNIKVVIIEVSSFGLMYFRTYGLNFQSVVLTNIAYNHHVTLHGSMDNYVKEKLKLFQYLSPKSLAVLPKESEYYNTFKKATKAKVVTYGFDSNNDFWLEGSKVHCPNQVFDLKLNIPGQFNLLNALAAIAVVSPLNISSQDIQIGLEKLKNIPGRLEIIESQAPFEIIVDKANTPLAFQSLIEYLKTDYRPKVHQIIAVYGTFNESPKEERNILAQIATQFFDFVIFTEDDPANEKREKSLEDFLSFVHQNNIAPDKYLTILDREEAIKTAIHHAQANDLIVILGRGNEQFMIYKNKRVPFDDREVAKKILEELKYLS
jgi:UDP-N-acetylmuramoyl-L-alanyl-D-glutamate--2,6-diaminopimelate ligase